MVEDVDVHRFVCETSDYLQNRSESRVFKGRVVSNLTIPTATFESLTILFLAPFTCFCSVVQDR